MIIKMIHLLPVMILLIPVTLEEKLQLRYRPCSWILLKYMEAMVRWAGRESGLGYETVLTSILSNEEIERLAEEYDKTGIK